MKKITLDQFLSILDRQLMNLDKSAESALNTSSKITHSFYVERIFEYGLDNEYRPIGTYSTKKTNFFRWNFLPKNYSKFKPSGYFYQNGRRIAYMTLNGYKQLKTLQGLRANTVNLTYTGELKRNFSQQPKKGNDSKNNKRMFVAINNTAVSNPSWDTPRIPKGKSNVNKVIKLTQQYRSLFAKHSAAEKNMFYAHFNRIFVRLNFMDTKWELTTSDVL